MAIDLFPEQSDELTELAAQLERERARNAGLERGLTALSERVDALRRENAELRVRLGGRPAGERRDRRQVPRFER